MDDFSKKNHSPTTNCFNNRTVAKKIVIIWMTHRDCFLLLLLERFFYITFRCEDISVGRKITGNGIYSHIKQCVT